MASPILLQVAPLIRASRSARLATLAALSLVSTLVILAAPALAGAQQQPSPDAFLTLFVRALNDYVSSKKFDQMDAVVRDNKEHVAVAMGMLEGQSLRSPAQADTLIGIALYLARSYERVFGESEFREQVEVFNALDPSSREQLLQADALLGEAASRIQVGKFQEGLAQLADAHRIYQAIGERARAIRATVMAAGVFSGLGATRRAIPMLEGALKDWRSLGSRDRRFEAVTLRTLGSAYTTEGDTARAIALYEQALAIFRDELHDTSEQSSTLSSLGQAYGYRGETRKALDYYESALELAPNSGAITYETLSYLGLLFDRIGDYPRAIARYREALSLMRDAEDPLWKPTILGNLANALIAIGEFDEAIKGYKEAEVGLRPTQSMDWVKVRGNLGLAYLVKGDLREAAVYLNTQPVDIFRQSLFFVFDGQYAKAVPALEILAKRAATADVPEATLGIYLTLARAYEGLGSVDRARDYYQQSAALVEQQREGLSEEQREHFFTAKILGVFTHLTPYEGLLRVSTPEHAFEYAESMKARRLLEQAAKREAARDPAIPDGVRTQEQQITRDLAALVRQKEAAVKRGEQDAIRAAEASLATTRQRRDTFVDTLYRQAPEYAAIRYPRPLKVDQVRLAPGEVLVEFAMTDTTLHAFVFRGTRLVTALRRNVARGDVEKLVDTYRRQLSDVARLTTPEFDQPTGYRLYEVLFKDVAPHLQPDDEVVIVPDGKLGLLPFEALPTTPQRPVMKPSRFGLSPAGITWLGDRYRIRYEQSASALMQRRSLARPVAAGGFFGLADPVFGKDDARARAGTSLRSALESDTGLALVRLEETGVLANRLARVFQGDGVDVLTGASATKANLLQRDLSRYRYLLFATHGVLGGKVSGLLEPALVLGWVPQRERDSFLTLSEAMTLRLNADVVGLTACETGVGKYVAAEGVMGMGRAFQYAGARSVLVSLWSVAEASTTALVERFFTYIKAGADPVSALQQARVDVRRAGYEHPFFWSPFILIGGGDVRRSRPPESSPQIAGAPAGTEAPLSAGAIVSHFVKVKTMGIGGTREASLTFRNILFDVDSAALKPESLAQLDEIGKALVLLTRERALRFRIEGHADATGADAHNMTLSQRRSDAIVRQLVARYGIPGDGLRAVGHGAGRPVAANDTDAGRRLNRRVEIVLDE